MSVLSARTCACGQAKAAHAQTCRVCFMGSIRQRANASKGGSAVKRPRNTCRKGLHEWTDSNIRPLDKTFLCVPCEEARLLSTAEETVLRNRRTTLRRYGLTLESFDVLLQACSNRCQICQNEFEETPHIDHDHKCCPERKRSCGKCIRGLLCSPCNRGLGVFEDSADKLRKAAEYLDRANR